MIRALDAILVAVAIAGAVWTYQIKHEADEAAKQARSLKAQIAAQNRKITLLEADWAIETTPARLEALAARFSDQLDLGVMQSTQIITSAELPPIREEPVEEDLVAGTVDERTTGGIAALIGRAEDDR